ncbi:hypothetical protein HYX07_03295 [Candidatus Woesearchaeota archaeon]|nr:hypothetical protein [Candidatus Woesearchaeota archaeon]
MSRKSQVTMLMVVGLVLFIVISLVLYLSKSYVKKQSQQNIKKTQESSMELLPIKEFVSKCLDKLGKDAIVLLGRQGGYIYSSQGGTLVDYQETDEGLFFVKYNNLDVAYNILPPKFAVPPYSSEIPDYPWQAFPYKTAASNAESFKGFFGISNMPPLNNSEGPNSMQSQIESFIDSNIQSCVNSEIFEKQGMNIEMQPPKTSVIIGSGSIAISTKMPISIINRNANEFAELNDFSSTLSIGLKDSYYFVKELVESDIQDIKFDIGDPKNEKEGRRIKLVKDVFSKDDIVIVTDENALLYGKSFEYIFARRNRAPALYYIR